MNAMYNEKLVELIDDLRDKFNDLKEDVEDYQDELGGLSTKTELFDKGWDFTEMVLETFGKIEELFDEISPYTGVLRRSSEADWVDCVAKLDDAMAQIAMAQEKLDTAMKTVHEVYDVIVFVANDGK